MGNATLCCGTDGGFLRSVFQLWWSRYLQGASRLLVAHPSFNNCVRSKLSISLYHIAKLKCVLFWVRWACCMKLYCYRVIKNVILFFMKERSKCACGSLSPMDASSTFFFSRGSTSMPLALRLLQRPRTKIWRALASAQPWQTSSTEFNIGIYHAGIETENTSY